MLLTVARLSAGYGKKIVVNDLSLEIAEREIVALIGHNGAGKSTLLDAIFGIIPVAGGEIAWRGTSLVGTSPSHRLRQGLAYAPQGGRVYRSLTIEENLELGAFALPDRSGLQQNIEKIFELFPVLFERRHSRAGQLSGGERQMLALGATLVSSPQLALLDEPSGGLAPILVEKSFAKIREIVDAFGTSVLLVEQNLDSAFAIADRAYVMTGGQITLSGTPTDIMQRAEFVDSYFGVESP